MIKFIIHIILEIVLFCFLGFNVLNIGANSLSVVFILLMLMLLVLVLTTRYRTPLNKRNSDVIMIVIGLSVAFIGLLYFASYFGGYDANYSSIFKDYITKTTWMTTFLIVIVTEVIRYILTLVDYRREKYEVISRIIMFMNYCLIDFIIIGKSYSLNTLSGFYDFFGLFLIQSVSKNLLLNYLSKNYGPSPCLWYRLIVELYVYFMPFVPRINLLIKATVLFVFPYFVFFIVKSLTEKRRLPKSRSRSPLDKISTIIFTIIFLVLVVLVSCEFKFAMIAVGSESMNGTINKGDAVIYERYDESKQDLAKGDIIVFKKNDVLIIHRIYKVFPLDKDESVYQTKGDNNDALDNWLVTNDEVVGIVKARVVWIAWPSVLLNEWFNK